MVDELVLHNVYENFTERQDQTKWKEECNALKEHGDTI